jgi:hypothetical protein
MCRTTSSGWSGPGFAGKTVDLKSLADPNVPLGQLLD